jgi:hypothetical protein
LKIEKKALKKYLAYLEAQIIASEADPQKYNEVLAGYEAEYRLTAKLVIQKDREIREAERFSTVEA